MIESLQNLRLGMDGRLLGGGGQGASTYASALRAAQQQIAPDAFVLSDASTLGATGPSRAARWLRALSPIGLRAAESPSDSGSGYFATDIFRLAQVWFDVHGRLFPVRLPGLPGIMHWSYPVPLRIVGWRNVYTIHDAIPLIHPRLTTIDPARHRRLLDRIAQQIERGGAVVTVSDAARRDIAETLRLRPEAINNCGVAIERQDDPAVPLPEALMPREYLLVCGTLEPRKNSLAIAESYRRSGVGLPLVFAGPPSDLDRHPTIAQTSGIIRLHSPDRRTMTALLARARAMLMPSLAEGFGLPIVEAMALGTPVLTSHVGALAETAGDAALLVDPADVTGLASAMARLAGNAVLRATLVAKGFDNAQRFTPARFAGRLGAVYEGLVAAKS